MKKKKPFGGGAPRKSNGHCGQKKFLTAENENVLQTVSFVFFSGRGEGEPRSRCLHTKYSSYPSTKCVHFEEPSVRRYSRILLHKERVGLAPVPPTIKGGTHLLQQSDYPGWRSQSEALLERTGPKLRPSQAELNLDSRAGPSLAAEQSHVGFGKPNRVGPSRAVPSLSWRLGNLSREDCL